MKKSKNINKNTENITEISENEGNPVFTPAFVPIRRSPALTAVTAISSVPAAVNGNKSAFRVKFDGKETKIGCLDDLSLVLDLNTQKFLTFLRLWYTRFNSSNRSDTINSGKLIFMLDDYLDVMGYSKRPDSRHRYYDQVNKCMDTLARVWLVSEFSTVYGLVTRKRALGVAKHINTVAKASTYIISNQACFGTEINSALVDCLDSDRDVNGCARIGIFALGALRLSSSKNAFAIVSHILSHFSYHLGKSNQCLIRVSELVDVCPELNYERNIDKIIYFERALDSLATGKVLGSGEYEQPILRWQYKYANEFYTPKQLRQKRLQFNKWLQAEVHFELLLSYKCGSGGRRVLDLKRVVDTTKALSYQWDKGVELSLGRPGEVELEMKRDGRSLE